MQCNGKAQQQQNGKGTMHFHLVKLLGVGGICKGGGLDGLCVSFVFCVSIENRYCFCVICTKGIFLA